MLVFFLPADYFVTAFVSAGGMLAFLFLVLVVACVKALRTAEGIRREVRVLSETLAGNTVAVDASGSAAVLGGVTPTPSRSRSPAVGGRILSFPIPFVSSTPATRRNQQEHISMRVLADRIEEENAAEESRLQVPPTRPPPPLPTSRVLNDEEDSAIGASGNFSSVDLRA